MKKYVKDYRICGNENCGAMIPWTVNDCPACGYSAIRTDVNELADAKQRITDLERRIVAVEELLEKE